MKTAAQYQHDIAAIKADEIQTQGLPPDQARAKIDQAESELRAIERALNLDLHALRSQYQGRAAALNIQNVRKSGRVRAEGEDHLHGEEESKLAPYEEVKKQVETALEQLTAKKAALG